jgi:hypothetical protein
MKAILLDLERQALEQRPTTKPLTTLEAIRIALQLQKIPQILSS